LRPTDQVIAIVCSDIHLSQRAPLARLAEPDWYAAMRRPLQQLEAIMEQHQAPLFIAGDVFDRWDAPPELINFALEHLPDCHALVGQHDLPAHNYKDLHRSAYQSLVLAGKISNMKPGSCSNFEGSDAVWYAFPFGCELHTRPVPLGGPPHVAFCHKYCWRGKPREFDTADTILSSLKQDLLGFDVAFFGDNHRGFSEFSSDRRPLVMNCGTLMRRKFDERDYTPQVGLLTAGGFIRPQFLDCSQDRFSDPPDLPRGLTVNMDDFLTELRELSDRVMDFRRAVQHACEARGVTKAVAEILLSSLDP
jgi:DNA repair exonuclease SbcCD nuclease subunit